MVSTATRLAAPPLHSFAVETAAARLKYTRTTHVIYRLLSAGTHCRITSFSLLHAYQSARNISSPPSPPFAFPNTAVGLWHSYELNLAYFTCKLAHLVSTNLVDVCDKLVTEFGAVTWLWHYMPSPLVASAMFISFVVALVVGIRSSAHFILVKVTFQISRRKRSSVKVGI